MRYPLFSRSAAVAKIEEEPIGICAVSESNNGSKRLYWRPVVIEGGAAAADTGAPPAGVDVRAEITAKRFDGVRTSQERYEASLRAIDGSPSSLIAALSAACRQIEELCSPRAPDERLILNISLMR